MSVSSVGEGGSSRRVAGRAGGNVTLLCGYDMKDRGPLSVCWNRGNIPSFNCNNMLIATDGLSVREDSRGSSRYQLLGRLDQGTCPWPSWTSQSRTLDCTAAEWTFPAGSMMKNTTLTWLLTQVRQEPQGWGLQRWRCLIGPTHHCLFQLVNLHDSP